MPYAGREEGHRYFYRHSSFTPRSTFFLPFSFSYPLPFPRRSPSYSVSPSLHFTLVPSYPPAQPLFLHLFAPLAPTFSVTLSTSSRHLSSLVLSCPCLTSRGHDSFLFPSFSLPVIFLDNVPALRWAALTA